MPSARGPEAQQQVDQGHLVGSPLGAGARKGIPEGLRATRRGARCVLDLPAARRPVRRARRPARVVRHRYGENEDNEPPELYSDLFGGTRDGTLGFLRDLHDLYIMASEADISWMLVGQAAQGARDQDLFGTVSEREGETAAQLKWLKTRMKQSASPDPAGSEAMSALPTANVQPVMPPLSADRGHPRGSCTPRGNGARTPST
jgi:hypothetical protein